MKTNGESGRGQKRGRCLPIICLIKLTGRIWERPKGGKRCQTVICPANLPESFLLKSILAEQCTRHHKGPWVRMAAQRPPGDQAHYSSTWGCQREAEQSSWVPLARCSPPPRPFPVMVLALSARVSSDSSFPSVRQKPTLSSNNRKYLNLIEIWSLKIC